MITSVLGINIGYLVTEFYKYPGFSVVNIIYKLFSEKSVSIGIYTKVTIKNYKINSPE